MAISTTLILSVASLMAVSDETAAAVDAVRQWPFTSPLRHVPPQVSQSDQLRNPVDAFVLAELEQRQLRLAAPAARRVQARRLYLDLIGIPPTPDQLEAFLRDATPNADEKLVDRLLADPRYAERWARHWLDVVRYGESDGLENDIIIGNLWRYRDWVIDAFDSDMPYDRFVALQIAGGDDVHPTKAWYQPDLQSFVPAGFFRLAPWDLGNLQSYELRQSYLDEVTGATAAVFLGLTLECAQCHDHKYDKIPMRDYYRFQAFFNAIQVPLPPNTNSTPPEVVDVPIANDGLRARAEVRIAAYKKKLQDEPSGEQAALLRRRIARWQPSVVTIKNVVGPPLGPDVPMTRVLPGGDLLNPGEAVAPGFPSVVTGTTDPATLIVDRFGQYPTRGRRWTLAKWITSPDNPLTARVMVNRIWSQHFAGGIVATPNDFGANGAGPTHPDLLDWLSVEFVTGNWSIKKLHRIMVTSATYCQDSENTLVDAAVDPENKWMWKFRRRRLEAEAIRDSMLAVSGQLSLIRYGPSVFPVLPESMNDLRKPVRTYSAAWDANETVEDGCRRSIYTFQQRSLLPPVMASFDAQVFNKSCPRRNVTTTPLQALSMMNGPLVNESAAWLAKRVLREAGSERRAQVIRLFEITLSRSPEPAEIERFVDFAGSVVSLARVLLSSNEFVYLD